MKDNGILKCERGAIVSKRFKYTNIGSESVKIEVISNTPAVVHVRESVFNITTGETETVKFIINAP